MSMREDREREDRERERRERQEQQHQPMSSEDLARMTGRAMGVAIGSLIIAAVALGTAVYLISAQPKVQKPSADHQMIMAIIDTLKAHRASIDYLHAHTDTTGVADLREKLRAFEANDEQRSADIIEMTDAFNRVYIHGTPPKSK